MQLQTVNSSKVTWSVIGAYEGDGSVRSFCADGDGIVQLLELSNKTYSLVDQCETVKTWNNVHSEEEVMLLLEQAQNYLAATYHEIYEDCCHGEEELFLYYTSSNFSGTSCIPLDKGRWVCRPGENDSTVYVFDESFNELELTDAIYEAAEVDGDNEDNPHYSAVITALAPIFSREQTAMSFVIDGISYTFEVKEFQV